MWNNDARRRFMTPRELWDRYCRHLCAVDSLGFRLDISRMHFDDAFLESLEPRIQAAFTEMETLEAGGIANPDEKRMVGHYWLRDPDRAPTLELCRAIEETLAAIESFTSGVHAARTRPTSRPRFTQSLVVGIGGSALGPQFVADALGEAHDPIQTWFFDNTDPAGIDRVLARLGDRLAETLTIVISKSGGTKETRNGMLEAREAYRARGLDFALHATGVTGEGSELDRLARKEGWLARFPMWDWVGGRTSELSAVGLLPAALSGFSIREILAGAREMDVATRERRTLANPAALLALMWYRAGDGRGARDMVVLPYCDRLLLFSRYLQQLVMESLGKEKDRAGRIVRQGIAVYGNKGSTDQHAYVQQLRDGVNNFFVTFIEVLGDRTGPSLEVEPDATSGDFLSGFLAGTRRALYEGGRESITLTVPDAGPRAIGGLIALFERAVGLYASLIDVNAYHQPGVEAGKKAAEGVLALQRRLLGEMRRAKGAWRTAEEIAHAIGEDDEVESAFKVLVHLAASPGRGVVLQGESSDPRGARFGFEG
jgi:glucose-6-phosphate isomerase